VLVLKVDHFADQSVSEENDAGAKNEHLPKFLLVWM